MDVFEAIQGRRTIGRVKQEPIDEALIGQLLEAGNWAPSHHATEPWRFFVMTGGGRQTLAEAYADIAVETAGGELALAPEQLTVLRSTSGGKAFRAPLVIAVAVSPSADKRVSRIEEFAAAHAAVQNMLLAAHAFGLGAIWRSGEPMYHPRMKRAFGLGEDEELVALLYVGQPEVQPAEGRRRPVSEKTTWLRGAVE